MDTYETGRPCRNGHLAKRYTQSGTCSACIKHASTDFRKRKNQRLAGALEVATFEGPPDAIAALRAYWKMVAPSPAPVEATGTTLPAEDRGPDWMYEQHVRIHGEAVAKQLHGRK